MMNSLSFASTLLMKNAKNCKRLNSLQSIFLLFLFWQGFRLNGIQNQDVLPIIIQLMVFNPIISFTERQLKSLVNYIIKIPENDKDKKTAFK